MRARVEELSGQEAFARQEKETTQVLIQEYTERMDKLRESLAGGRVEQAALEEEREKLGVLTTECTLRGQALSAELEEVNVTLQDAGDARRVSRSVCILLQQVFCSWRVCAVCMCAGCALRGVSI